MLPALSQVRVKVISVELATTKNKPQVSSYSIMMMWVVLGYVSDSLESLLLIMLKIIF